MRDLPLTALAYVVLVPLLALVLAAVLAARWRPDGAQVLLAGLLLATGALSVEASRRTGEPAGTAVKDLLSVWWLPMAVLLPPVFVLLAPFPLMALTQWRVRPAPVHRRVFSAASIGLSYVAVAAAFSRAGGAATPPTGAGLLPWALGAAAAGVAAGGLNALLVALAVRASDPQARWRDLLWDPENLRLDAVEVCLGVIVAVVVGLDPVLVLFAVPPVLVLQRGLLHAQLRAVALLDLKTGLLNAHAWEREAEGKLLALRKAGLPAAVLLVDIDHFKRVNDTYGHLAGDAVLRAVAGALAGGVRDGDVLGRFGGEEFVALLPAADESEAARVAERLRRLVAAAATPLESGQLVEVTVSIGAATTRRSGLGVADLLAAADHCMYQAKAAGRNTVVPRAMAGGL